MRYTETKYVIFDNVTDEYLVDYECESWESHRDGFDSSAMFDTRENALLAVIDLTERFLKDDPENVINFEVREYKVGQGLYEVIRKAMVDEYGDSLRRLDLDHDMAEAVMEAIKNYV